MTNKELGTINELKDILIDIYRDKRAHAEVLNDTIKYLEWNNKMIGVLAFNLTLSHEFYRLKRKVTA